MLLVVLFPTRIVADVEFEEFVPSGWSMASDVGFGDGVDGG